MIKKEEIDLIKIALSKLNYIKSKKYHKEIIDEISFVFNVFIKNYYSLHKEVTHTELKDTLSRKPIEESEKALLIKLDEELEHIKYGVKNPSKARVKKLLSKIIHYLKSKLSKIDISDMIKYVKLKISEVK